MTRPHCEAYTLFDSLPQALRAGYMVSTEQRTQGAIELEQRATTLTGYKFAQVIMKGEQVA